MIYYYRAELEREAGGRIFNAAEGTETHSQAKISFSHSMVGYSSMDLFSRWRILVTKDLPSHLDHLVPTALVDHRVHTAPAVDHLATHPDLLSSPAQAREQPAPPARWTRTTWWRRTEESGSGPR